MNPRFAFPKTRTIVRLRRDYLRIRGPSGLGDAIYMRPIVETLLHKHPKMEILTRYGEIFAGLKGLTTAAFSKRDVNIVAHYGQSRTNPRTTQFQDMCSRAGLPLDTPFRTEWEVKNKSLTERIEEQARGRKIVLVHGGRYPMAREFDPRVIDLLPLQNYFNMLIQRALYRDCMVIRIGHGEKLYDLDSELDLWGKTGVTDLMDLGKICDGVIAQCSFAVPLAEIFMKPVLGVWSAKTAQSQYEIIRCITPQKIFVYPETSRHVIDDYQTGSTREIVDAFLDF